MTPFEVGGHNYQARPMDVFDQMVVAKRLAPLMAGIMTPEILGSAMSGLAAAGNVVALDRVRPKKGAVKLSKDSASTMLQAMATAIASLSDEDVLLVTKKCLALCTREQPNAGWAPVTNANGDLQFADITVPQVLQISYKVIEPCIAGFFTTAP